MNRFSEVAADAEAYEAAGETIPTPLLTKLAAQFATTDYSDIPWCHVANLAALDGYYPDKDLWLWLPRINQPRMPWLSRRPQLTHPTARTAVDGTLTITQETNR